MVAVVVVAWSRRNISDRGVSPVIAGPSQMSGFALFCGVLGKRWQR